MGLLRERRTYYYYNYLLQEKKRGLINVITFIRRTEDRQLLKKEVNPFLIRRDSIPPLL